MFFPPRFLSPFIHADNGLCNREQSEALLRGVIFNAVEKSDRLNTTFSVSTPTLVLRSQGDSEISVGDHSVGTRAPDLSRTWSAVPRGRCARRSRVSCLSAPSCGPVLPASLSSTHSVGRQVLLILSPNLPLNPSGRPDSRGRHPRPDRRHLPGGRSDSRLIS